MHQDIAARAIKEFPIKVASIEFVTQSGSTVYKVSDCDGNQFCLRLYASVDGVLGEEWTGEKAILSMLQWMDVLSVDLPDIVIPKPYLNVHGEFLTKAEGIFCSVESWLDGEKKPYFMTETDVRKVGVLLAKLHRHTANWMVSAGFERPCFDSRCIDDTLIGLQKTTLCFSNHCVAALKEGAERTKRLVDSFEKTKDTWGIIHADIIPPNLLYHCDELRPIDFGACGFGHYVWDIATTMPFVPLHLRKALIDAYAAVYPLPDDYIQVIEGFFIACRLQVLGFFLHLPDATMWVPDEYEKFAQRELASYLEGRTFLFEGTPYYA